MPNYTVDALRTIRSIEAAHARGGHTAQAEQMRRVGDQVEAMQAELYDWQERANEHANNSAAATTELIGLRAELAALKEAARPVARWWHCDKRELTERRNVICAVDAAKLDSLARLCGEE